MQPYQAASQEMKRQGELPLKTLGNAASLAATAGTAFVGGSIASKVIPFLSQYVPQDLAIKGLSKIDPRFGTFINKALENGKSFDDVKEFIQEKVGQEQEKVPEQRNIIQKHSDKLHEFLDTNIKKGLTPTQAVSLAEIFPHHKKTMDQIVKEHKSPFLNIVESIYGSPQQALSQQNMQPKQSKSSIQPQQPAQGNADQALLAALDKILKM